MDTLLRVIGLTCVMAVVVDAAATTLMSGRRAGRWTAPPSQWAGAAGRRLSRDGRRRRVQQWIGPVALVVPFLLWVVLLWAGWTLAYSPADLSRVDGTGQGPASWTDRVYYAGFTISTLGVGDVVPNSTWARLASPVAALTGLALITAGIASLLSTVSALVQRRSIAIRLHASAPCAAALLIECWDGDRLTPSWERAMHTTAGELAVLAELHHANPVLHLFTSPDRTRSAPHAVATLDDALLLAEHVLAPSDRPAPRDTAQLHRMIEMLAREWAMLHRRGSAAHAPSAAYRDLAAAGLPLADESELQAAADALRHRRAVLAQAARASVPTE